MSHLVGNPKDQFSHNEAHLIDLCKHGVTFYRGLPVMNQIIKGILAHKAQNTTIAEFNTVDPDETAHNEPSHQDLQCLPSSP